MRVTAALAREAAQPLEIAELDLDEPRADEVRVRMVATGVCHTDARGRGHRRRRWGRGHDGEAGRPRRARLQLLRELRELPLRASGVLCDLPRAQLRWGAGGRHDLAARRRDRRLEPL